MDEQKDGTETLFQFPCEFPIKVMGPASADFRSLVLGILAKHFGDIDRKLIEERPSSGGKYLGLTVTVWATSKAQVDDAYRELTSCQQVLVAL